MNAVFEIKVAGAGMYEQTADGWYIIGPVSDVFDGRMCKGIELEATNIGLFRVEGEIHALDDICTHGAALLTDGEFEGHEVECPLHAGLVDVRTGKALSAPITRATRHHETRIEADILYVRLQA